MGRRRKRADSWLEWGKVGIISSEPLVNLSTKDDSGRGRKENGVTLSATQWGGRGKVFKNSSGVGCLLCRSTLLLRCNVLRKVGGADRSVLITQP